VPLATIRAACNPKKRWGRDALRKPVTGGECVVYPKPIGKRKGFLEPKMEIPA